MQKKGTLLISVFIAFTMYNVTAQEYFSFYQLRDYVFQTQSISPTYMPQNTFTIAIPGSNFGVNYQNGFQLKDVLVENTNSGALEIDLGNLLLHVENINTLKTNVTGHLFYMGLRKGKNAFSVFLNTKTDVNVQLTKPFFNFLANGNSSQVGELIDLGHNKFNATAYREIGFGYVRTFLDNKFKVGFNLRFLGGVFHASTQHNAELTLLTKADTYNWEMTAQNATVNTAGLDLIINKDNYPNNALTSYIFGNKNRGIAFDLGASYQLSKKFIIEISTNDIGSITWKEHVINYNIEDGSGTFTGLDLKDIDDVEQAFENELSTIFTTNETQRSFKTKLGVKSYVSTSYLPNKKNRFSLTGFNNYTFNDFSPSFALAYNRTLKRSTFGVTSSFGGHQKPIGFGGNFAVSLGALQIYAATDNIISKVENVYNADFRFGINLNLGYKKWVKEDKPEG
ncbi:DUF5723 family protein [Flavivirga aquimarina]|uniref:DUF5723 family protein n=1 Tax=Flavivirga aquimarina TaxID=2027862 RepID=A0ABT8W5G9_9FLAO|nr:DUF5723 family protein [Flavivirga aquimarina]MDO5968351.1 DUF5723 family protein [Flavivirga aquimarina]